MKNKIDRLAPNNKIITRSKTVTSIEMDLQLQLLRGFKL